MAEQHQSVQVHADTAHREKSPAPAEPMLAPAPEWMPAVAKNASVPVVLRRSMVAASQRHIGNRATALILREDDPPAATPATTLKQKVEYELTSGVVDSAGLKKSINAASASEKEDVWSDAALMTRLHGQVGEQTYLDMVVALGMAHTGTPAEGGGAHKSGTEADTIIRDKLATEVAEAVKAGKQVVGSVAIVGEDDWKRAGEAHYGKDTWNNAPSPGKDPKKDAINAFVDSQNRIWIHKDRGNAGTAIHEGLHKYAKDDLLTSWGFNFNEGITEFFTRKICGALPTPIVRGNYAEQYAFVKLLVDQGVATDAGLAKAYFDADLAGAKTIFLNKQKEKVSAEVAENRWNKVIEKMKAGEMISAGVWAKPD